MKENIKQLQQTIEKLHNCTASYVTEINVTEKFDLQIVWEGIVHVFNIEGHPKANKCYAWSSPIDESTKRRYYAVLHIPPIDSPEKAIRASIVQDHKTKQN